MEFIILFGFVLFFFTVFTIVINSNLNEREAEKRSKAIKELALDVQNEVNLALNSVEGYQRSFFVPLKVYDRDYCIELISEADVAVVYIITKDKLHSISLPIPLIDSGGKLIKGDYNLVKREGDLIVFPDLDDSDDCSDGI